MELETDRLRLREWQLADREPFYRMNIEPEVQRFLSPIDRDASDAMLAKIDRQFAENGWGFWAIEERETGQLIGMCGLAHATFEAFFTPAVEIGWRLSAKWQGKGYAREAAQRCLEFGFNDLNLPRIVSFTTPANTASWGLMKRIGMEKIGEFNHLGLPSSHPLSRHVAYQIDASHYSSLASPGAK